MNDLTEFCMTIAHAKNVKGIESASCNAIKFDDGDGFVKSLTTNYAQEHKVDYIEIVEQGAILIELKDIKSKVNYLLTKKKAKEEIQESLLSNLENKFTRSLGIIQREINPNLVSIINYLVVANGTESTILDKYLPENLKKEPFVICKTDEICNKLSTLTTRICQE
ncbi:MAG: hypothetical protein Ctma_1322 [Catillopecten margaritatus gill symbiont]|uniref:Uncharacterized protein n=1 Tax=Catillopecten margaritatus gill symbiont TaxID=3083288 RepID=A0AAU6PHW3_9GAMM